MMLPEEISCCLITKDPEYPEEILKHLSQWNWGETLVLTNSDSPFRKHELFAKAKFPHIYYQDDDAICPVGQLLLISQPDMINVAMKRGHMEAYQASRGTMGLGWGSIFPKALLLSLRKYTDIYGEDDVYKRETERIFTALNWPQNRFVLPIEDLPSAMAEDRLWRQPHHNEFRRIAEERCRIITG